MNKEIEIPEGYEARIEGNKVILERKSEDNRIMREIIETLRYGLAYEESILMPGATTTLKEAIAYLERQKYKEKYDRMAPIYEDKKSFESALDKAWKFYNESASATVDGFEDNFRELTFAKGFREGFLYKEKQREQKPVEGAALQKAFISSKIDYTLEEKCDASDYADAILPTSVAYGENEEEYKLHKIIEAAFIAGQKKEHQSVQDKKEQKLVPKFKVGDRIYDKKDSYNRNVIREVGKDYYINAFAQKMDMAYTDANFEFLEHLDNDSTTNKPTEWSEEDEEMLRIISNRLDKFSEWATEQGYPIDDPTMKQTPISWLKSFPKRLHL